jgi:hypothetical protein
MAYADYLKQQMGNATKANADYAGQRKQGTKDYLDQLKSDMDNRISNQTTQVNQQKAAIPEQLRPEYERNDIQEFVNQRNGVANSANMGMSNSGYAREFQTSAGVMRQKADTATRQKEQSAADSLTKQLDEYIRNNTINMVERICINKSMMTVYSKDNQYEYATVYLSARMNDYIIDAETKQVVKGDRNREFHSNYNLKFMRSLGVKTTVNSGKSTTNCPNCGAPTQITSAGECEYCNSVITTGQHDWVLCDLDGAQ